MTTILNNKTVISVSGLNLTEILKTLHSGPTSTL